VENYLARMALGTTHTITVITLIFADNALVGVVADGEGDAHALYLMNESKKSIPIFLTILFVVIIPHSNISLEFNTLSIYFHYFS
jgi:hypothetical protein